MEMMIEIGPKRRLEMKNPKRVLKMERIAPMECCLWSYDRSLLEEGGRHMPGRLPICFSGGRSILLDQLDLIAKSSHSCLILSPYCLFLNSSHDNVLIKQTRHKIKIKELMNKEKN